MSGASGETAVEPARPTSTGEQQRRKKRPTPAHKRERPGGSPVLLILALVVVVPAVVVADRFDAGPAGIIGGLVGLFSLVALMGGSLRADLRVAVVLVPLLLFAAVAPRLVAEVSRPLAVALVVVLVFVAALLPGLGPRFTNTGMGLGMTTLYAYAYATHGTAHDRQVLAAAVAGVLVALGVRLLFGVSDPSRPTREQVAQSLVGSGPDATRTGFDAWLSEGRPRWLATVLGEGSRFRVALRRAQLAPGATSYEQTVTALKARSAALADQVRAKKPPGDDAELPVAPVPPGAPSELREAAAALDTVERAVRERDTSRVPLGRGTRRALRDAVMHPSARFHSVRMRHAVRTAFGLLVMLLVTAPLDPSDPIVVSVLMTTFSILQISWRETWRKVRAKVAGLVVGVTAVGVILLTAPQGWLMPVAGISLCLGLWYVVTRPAVGAAFMVVVSVGFNSVTRDLNATDLLVRYAGLTVAAVVTGLVLGFAVVPAFRPPPLRSRIEEATEATARALRAASSGASPTDPQAVALHREANQKQAELAPDHDKLDDRQLAELDRLREGLRDLTTIADAESLDRAALTGAVELLTTNGERGGPTAVPASDGLTSTVWDLAEQSVAAERYLLRTLPAPS